MTIIKSKVERSYWKNAALSAVPDVLIAWAAMRLMDGGVEVFFGTLIALQAVYLALWIKRSAWSWLLFWLTNRSMMSGHIEEVLAQQRFPRPPDFISGPDEYYSGIVDDESVKNSIRLKAAQELGTLAWHLSCRTKSTCNPVENGDRGRNSAVRQAASRRAERRQK